MKKFGIFLIAVALLAAVTPWALYGLGRMNITALPEPPPDLTYGPSEEALVWAARDEIFPPTLRAITPWHFYNLLWCSHNDKDLEDFLTCDEDYPGLRAAAYAAKYHLRDHMERDGVIWRYLSRTALTIWISDTWTKDELVAYLIMLQRSGYVGD
jgi:hypothetical protein